MRRIVDKPFAGVSLFAVALLFCAAFAHAQNVRSDGVVQSRSGAPAPGASVFVCTQPATTTSAGCMPAPTLCSSLTDTSCTQPNPVTADGLGNYHFYLPIASFPVTICYVGSTVTTYCIPDQTFGLAGGQVVNLASPPAIGNTTPNTVASTALSSTQGLVITGATPFLAIAPDPNGMCAYSYTYSGFAQICDVGNAMGPNYGSGWAPWLTMQPNSYQVPGGGYEVPNPNITVGESTEALNYFDCAAYQQTNDLTAAINLEGQSLMASNTPQPQNPTFYTADMDCRGVRSGAGTMPAAQGPWDFILGTGWNPVFTGHLQLPQGTFETCESWWLPGGTWTEGEGPFEGQGFVGTTIQANPSCFLPTYSDLIEGSVTNTSCSGAGPYSCAITATGTHFTTKTEVNMAFAICTANTTGRACGTNNATNTTWGRITAINSDTSLTISTYIDFSTNSSGTYSFVAWNPGVVEGDWSGSTAQPANMNVRADSFSFDCNGVKGCGGYMLGNAQNLSAHHYIRIYPGPSGAAFDGEGGALQNRGADGPTWVIGQAGQCDQYTTGFFYRGSTAAVLDSGSFSVDLSQCNSGAGVGSGNASMIIDGPVVLNGLHVLPNGSSSHQTGIGVAVGMGIEHPTIAINAPQPSSNTVLLGINCQNFGLTCLEIGNTETSYPILIGGLAFDGYSKYPNLFIDQNQASCDLTATDSSLIYALDNAGNILYSSAQSGCNGSTTKGVARAAAFSADQAGTCAPGNFTVGSGWGTGASVGSTFGYETCQTTITSGSGSFSASPTITYTLPQALPVTQPCTMDVHAITGSGGAILFANSTHSASAPVFTAVTSTGGTFTPAASETYTVVVRCGP